MKKLLGGRVNGSVVERDWMHYGDDGRKKITVESTEDVTPVFESVKRQAQAGHNKNMGRLVCEVPETVVTEIATKCAKTWGCKTHEALGEIVNGKTSRAKEVLTLLKFSRDYRKFQTKHYA